MNRDFDLIVFDWDGTLMDSTAIIARSIQAAADDLGVPVPDLERANHVIGLGLREAIAHAVPELPVARIADFSDRYRHHYLQAEETLLVFDGVRELLADLHATGLPLAIATGKSRRGLIRSLAATELTAYFCATRCADQTDPKPCPAMLLEIADELQIVPARALMIGDTTHDLEMARAAGTQSIGVSWGAHPRSQLLACAPLAVVDTVAELRAWIGLH